MTSIIKSSSLPWRVHLTWGILHSDSLNERGLLNFLSYVLSCRTCLLPYLLWCLTYLVPYVLSCFTCLVSYMLSCLTRFMPYVLSCLTCLVLYLLSCSTRASRASCSACSRTYRASCLACFRVSRAPCLMWLVLYVLSYLMCYLDLSAPRVSCLASFICQYRFFCSSFSMLYVTFSYSFPIF